MKFKTNNKFWNKFYTKKKIQNPSKFAKFVCDRFIKNRKIVILDLGCGDGRDGFYFSKKKIKKILCIDSSPIVIQNNNVYKNKKKTKNINFICLKAQSPKLLTLGNFDIVYSRFFLHTISKVTQDKIFKNLIKITKTNSLICLEFRTIKDSLCLKGKSIGKHERITDHYRRFIDLNELINLSYIKNNFSIIHKIEDKNLAKYKNENPVVARLVLGRL